MERTFTVLAAVLAFLAVAIGAFGAHGLKEHFESHPELEPIFEVGARYHMYHALGLLAVAWVASRRPGAAIRSAGIFFVLGIVLFSGSLYGLSLSGVKWLGAITPFGGLAFLIGWVLLAVGAARGDAT